VVEGKSEPQGKEGARGRRLEGRLSHNGVGTFPYLGGERFLLGDSIQPQGFL
jgi:hypothetical protein